MKNARYGLWRTLCWMHLVMRVRRIRHQMLFSQRLKFDDALRHRLPDGAIVAYPDSLYMITLADYRRALAAAIGDCP